MAISIISNPSLIQPVYSPFYYVFQSTNTSQIDFKYVIDVYSSTSAYTASNYIGRYKILPRPNDVYCIFSPARLLESYLSYDLGIHSLSGHGSSISTNCITQYYLGVGEEYKTASTQSATTIYSGLTTVSGYTFNGVIQYENIPSWSYYPYITSASTASFLTNQPSSVQVRNSTDRASISFLSISGNARFVQVEVTAVSGGTRTWNLNNYSLTATSINRMISHYGTGIWNINNNYFSTANTIHVDTDLSYTVCLLDALSNQISEKQTYLINQRCSRYETKRLMFLNSFGNWDYFNFDLISRKTLSSNKNFYTKMLPYNYTIGSRGKTVLDSTNQETITVNSDWINDDEAEWMGELLMSPEVYELRANGDAIPIIINDNSKDINKTINDRLFNINFSYNYAFEKYSQRNS